MKNRIINLAVFAFLCAAFFYCIRYGKDSKAVLTETEGFQVSIYGEEKEEGEEEKADPYQESFLPVSVTAMCGNWSKEISLYVSDGICYAFLPAYTQMNRLSCIFDDSVYEVWIEGRKMASGSILEDIEQGVDYGITIEDPVMGKLQYQMVFMQSQNLPSVFIDTQSGSMDYVDADKGNEEPGQFCCVTAQGEIDSKSAMERIRGRGNTSWEGPGGKNQYNVRLTDSTDVLKMGSAHNWIVQANKLDVSMMRNKLAYDFARDIGIPYAVECEHADLYFNGRYMGTYLVCEKVEVAAGRIEEDAGYLLETNFRAEDSETAFTTDISTFLVNYPQVPTAEEYGYIADYVRQATGSILLAGQSDRCFDYIDLSSFAKLYIIDELGNDPDNNALSTFYYKKDSTEDTRLTAGPVWDFDIALGNDERCAEILNSYYGEGWFEYLYRNQTFRKEVSGQLQEIMDSVYDKYEHRYFEDMTQYMKRSVSMNEIRWKKKEGYIASYYPEFEGTMKYLNEYFTARLKNLDYVFNGPDRIHKVEFLDRGRQYAHTFVKDGEVIAPQVLLSLEQVDGVGSYSLDSEQAIDPASYPVYSDIRVNCRPPGSEAAAQAADGKTAEVLQPVRQGADQGELAMQWISFIMLMVPGLISVWISGNTKVKKDNIFAVVTQYLLNSFLVLLLAYGIFYVMYGSAVLSFSDLYSDSYDYSIYNVNVAFKYLALAGGLSLAVGAAERFLIAFARKKGASTSNNK